jgi:parvulin-like peptidyl-prolyl isomerase
LCAVGAPATVSAPPSSQPQISSSPGRNSILDAAAVVDGHVIPRSDIELLCLRTQRGYVVDQMVQNFMVERECGKRGIVVTEAEIDRSIAELRKEYAPAVLEDTIKAHGWTIPQLRQQFRAKIGRQRLVMERVKLVKMVHCREILVKCRQSGIPSVTGSAGRTEAEALTIIRSIQEQLNDGKEFGDLAQLYSESEPRGANGDIGVLYGNMVGNVEGPVLAESLTLKKGQVSKVPVKTAEGYCLIQAISTSDDHSTSEETIYQEADTECRRVQAMFLEPTIIGALIRQSKITYATDDELIPGKSLPIAAATIDNHPILMKDVLAKCVADGGREAVDNLVQNYVVDRECERRGIVVSESEVDQAVANLRRRIAPHTIEEGLPAHHTTMAGLRNDFKQQIERTKLVLNQVKPATMVHCRLISLQDTPAEQPPSLLAAVQAQLKSGKDFAELARQYSRADSKNQAGDAGILYPGMLGADTALLNAALTMKKGQITPEAVKTYDGYVLIQAVSTSDDHSASEAPLYAEALATYKEQQAQPLILEAVRELVKKSKVTYFLKS